MSIDLTKALAPKSDQANADDFLTGPRTFTVKEVIEDKDGQKVSIHLVEYPGKPYRPAKTMLRVLAHVHGWGKHPEAWAGRRLTLYTDPDVMFSGEKVGGIRISHMSHLKRPLSIPLTVTRGNKRTFTVQPLNDAPATPTINGEQWSSLHAKAQELNIEDVGKWIGDQLGRTLQGWQEITVAEADKLRAELDSMTPAPADTPAESEPTA